MDGVASRLKGREVIAQWLRRAVPQLDVTRQRVAVQLTRLLTAGAPVTMQRLAAELALPPAAVGQAIDGLRTVTRDEVGRATSACGLTLSETDHRVTFDGRPDVTLHTWCAWDTFIVAGLVGVGLRSSSRCPVTNEVVSVHVNADGAASAEPSSTVMSLALVDISEPAPIGATFCRFVRFLTSPEACGEWVAGRHHVVPVSLDDAADLARTVNLATFPTVLGEAA